MAHAIPGSLPQLSGRLLWLYRILWCALAVGAIAASSAIALRLSADAPIVVLRLVKSGVLLTVATILFYRRQRDPVAALLGLAFLTWTVTSSFDLGTDLLFARVLDRCRFLLFALALLLFPDGRWEPGWTRIVAGLSAATFLLGTGEALNIVSTRLFLPLAIPCVIAGIVSLFVRFRASSSFTLRQQLKWVALGLVVGVALILGARGGAVLSKGGAMPIIWEALFQLGIIVLALGFLISLLRYRLFDAESVISRSAAYAALTIALVATFGGTEAVIENIGQAYLGMNIGSVSGAMAAAVAAVLLNPLHDRITQWAEARFQPDLVRLKREAPETVGRLAWTSSPRLLAAAYLPQVNTAIHATHSALLLDGRVIAASGIPLRQARRSVSRTRDSGQVIFPVRLPIESTESDMATSLLLGPRPDGTFYGKEDLDAVRFTLPAVRHAMTAARAREAIGSAMVRREKQIREELRRINDRLLALE